MLKLSPFTRPTKVAVIAGFASPKARAPSLAITYRGSVLTLIRTVVPVTELKFVVSSGAKSTDRTWPSPAESTVPAAGL